MAVHVVTSRVARGEHLGNSSIRKKLLVLVIVAGVIFGFAPPASATPPLFVGDFETGNFDQWPVCQDVAVYSVACSSMQEQTYSMRVETDVVRQGKYAARFEVRHGDQPAGLCCGDRAEVSGDDATFADEGDDRWYQWSTFFGDGFPTSKWSVVSQWHADVDGSPPLAFVVGGEEMGADRWGIVATTWNGPGNPGPRYTPWSTPMVRGVWNDIRLHVKWSADPNVGLIEFWLNGEPQTFQNEPCKGQTRCQLRTLMPGGGGVYFKQGYYRDSGTTETGVVYHDAFTEADSPAGLPRL